MEILGCVVVFIIGAYAVASSAAYTFAAFYAGEGNWGAGKMGAAIAIAMFLIGWWLIFLSIDNLPFTVTYDDFNN